MKTVREISDILGISAQRLAYWLRKDDAPIPEYLRIGYRMIRHYDEKTIIKYWKAKNARYSN